MTLWAAIGVEEKESNKQRHFKKMQVIRSIFEETTTMVVNICCCFGESPPFCLLLKRDL